MRYDEKTLISRVQGTFIKKVCLMAQEDSLAGSPARRDTVPALAAERPRGIDADS